MYQYVFTLVVNPPWLAEETFVKKGGGTYSEEPYRVLVYSTAKSKKIFEM